MPATTTESLLGPTTGQLILEVTQEGTATTTHTITEPKCTIGSGEACGIQIQGDGIRPVHCVVLRSYDRTIVRRWAGNTWLNGRPFDDTSLRVGDELRLANVRIRVLKDERDAVPRGGARLRNALSSASTWTSNRSRPETTTSKETPASPQSYQAQPAPLESAEPSDSGLASRIAALESMLQNVVQSPACATQDDADSDWQQEKIEYDRKLAEVNARVQELEATTIEQENDIERLQHEVENARAESDARLTEEAVDDGREAVWQAKFDELEAEREAEEAVNRQYQENLQNKVQELSDTVSEYESEIQDLNEQLTQRQHEVAEVRDELTGKQKELETLVETASEVDTEKVAELEKQLEEDNQLWEGQKAELNEKIAALESQVTESSQAWETEKTQLADQISAFEETAAAHAELGEKCDTLTSERDELAKERDELVKERDELSEQMSDLQSAHDETSSALAELQGKHDQLDREREELEQQRSQLESERALFSVQTEGAAGQSNGYVDVALDYATSVADESAVAEIAPGVVSPEASDESLQEPTDASRFLDSLNEVPSSETATEEEAEADETNVADVDDLLAEEHVAADDTPEPEASVFDTLEAEASEQDEAAQIVADVEVESDSDVVSDSGVANRFGLDLDDEDIFADDTANDATAEHPAPVSTDDDLDEASRGWQSDEEPIESDDPPLPVEDEPFDSEDEERAESQVFADDTNTHDFLDLLSEKQDAGLTDQGNGDLNWSALFDEESAVESAEETVESVEASVDESSVDEASVEVEEPSTTDTMDFLKQLNDRKVDAGLEFDENAPEQDSLWAEASADEPIVDSGQESAELSNSTESDDSTNTHDFLSQIGETPDFGLTDDAEDDDAWQQDETVSEAEGEPAENNTHDFLNSLGEKPDFGLTDEVSTEEEYGGESADELFENSDEQQFSDSFDESPSYDETTGESNTHDFLSKLGEKPDFGLTDDSSNDSFTDEFSDEEQDDDGIDAFLTKLGQRPAAPEQASTTEAADVELDEWGLPIEGNAPSEASFDSESAFSDGFDDSSTDGLFEDQTFEEASTPEEDYSQLSDDGVEDGSDVSIEDYMNNLLSRVGGGSAQPTASVQSVVSEDVSPDLPLPPMPSTPVLADDPSDQILKPSEFVPRSRAPEENLAAMRELANASTRSAIDRADKSRTGMMLMTNVGASWIPILVGLSLIMFGFRGYYTLLLFGCVCCAVGAYMLQKSLKALRESKALAEGKLAKAAKSELNRA